MMHAHSLNRAKHQCPDRAALVSGGKRTSFRELHGGVGRMAATLREHGFGVGDRLAILLPNEPDYLELVFACSWLGVVAVPLNIRLSSSEVDHVLADADRRGLVRHSTLPAPTARLPQQWVADEQPLVDSTGALPEAVYDPEAILALIYTSGTTRRPKDVVVTQHSRGRA
jgi:acyl-CoA synthetase (AMP-forming)/AMP-acid ligase II